MKKSLMVTGSLMILGIVWTGISWYSGKLIEQHLESLTVSVNTHIKQEWPAGGITLTLQDYQRGIFSSSARYLLRAEGHALSQNLLPSDELIISQTISHGPFPLAQLKKFNFIPQMASVHLMLNDTPAVRKLFDITEGQSPIEADSRIAYNGDSFSDIIMMPVHLNMDSITLKLSGTTLQARHSATLHSLSFSGKAESIVLTAKNHEDKTEQLTFKDFTLNSSKKPGKFGLNMGDDQLDIGQLLLNIDGRDIVTIAMLHVKTTLNETDRHINGQMHYTLSALHLYGHHFGSGSLTINADRLDGQAVKELAPAWHQTLAPLWYQDKNSNADNRLAQWEALVLAKFPAFLQSSPDISIAPFSWKNSKGESQLTFKLTLTDPAAGSNAQPVRQHKFDFDTVKNMDMTLTMPMPMLRELVTQVALLRGHGEEEARKLAQQQVQGLSALGQLFKLTVTKDETISSHVRYADNQAELNGQKIPLQELIDLFSPFSIP